MGRWRLRAAPLAGAVCVALLAFGGRISHAQEVTITLEVRPYQLVEGLTAVRVMVSTAPGDTLPVLLSATIEILYNADLFKYRAANGADVSDFVSEWLKDCGDRTQQLSDCLTGLPYNLSQNDIPLDDERRRVRTDIYTNLGYDPNMGPAGMEFGEAPVAISLFVFEPKTPDVVSDDADSFVINRKNATVSFYSGLREKGGIGNYVDCLWKDSTCLIQFVE